MKKTSQIITIASLLTSVCLAQVSPSRSEQKRLDSARALATALKVPLVTTSQVWTEPFFPVEGELRAKDYRIVKRDASNIFDVYSNDQIIATGGLYEHSTPEDARIALMRRFTDNSSMAVDTIVELIYQSHDTGAGDFRFSKKRVNAVAGTQVDDYSVMFFGRGAKVITFGGVDGVDVRPIAEALDELLKHPPERNVIQDKPPEAPPLATSTMPNVETTMASSVATNLPQPEITESKTTDGQTPLPEDKTPSVENKTPPQETATASWDWRYAVLGILLILGVCALALRKRKQK